jgi:pyrimidine-specific ribonucleoside hydrolase
MPAPARTIPLILDVDTGVDDAFALLFAARHPGFDLLGVSCVDGNVDVDKVVLNTLTVLDAAGADTVPVARGAQRPLVNRPSYATEVHGQDGLGDLGLPMSTRQPVAEHAVTFLRDLVTASPEPVVLVALAPLTNIALLVRTYPEVFDNIAQLVIMGGAIGQGNATATAEFNVWHDPEAAAVVFSSGLPITMYGLDVFHTLQLAPELAEQLAASADPGAALGGQLVLAQLLRQASDLTAESFVTLGDYGAVALVAEPEAARFVTAPVAVVTGDGPGRGQTVVDLRPYRDALPADRPPVGEPVRVTLAVDAERYVDLWVQTLLAPRRP